MDIPNPHMHETVDNTHVPVEEFMERAHMVCPNIVSSSLKVVRISKKYRPSRRQNLIPSMNMEVDLVQVRIDARERDHHVDLHEAKVIAALQEPTREAAHGKHLLRVWGPAEIHKWMTLS